MLGSRRRARAQLCSEGIRDTVFATLDYPFVQLRKEITPWRGRPKGTPRPKPSADATLDPREVICFLPSTKG